MAWLSDWLRQIIALILLAGIIDLLLPSNAYQRYVRLVVGLLILLTLLSPILRLLQGDFESKLTEGLSGWPIVANTGKMQGLELIQKQGQQLQEERMKQAAQLTERRFADTLREQLPKLTGYGLEDVEVRIERNERTGDQVVASVVIVLKHNEMGGVPNNDKDKEQTVKTVEPVAVEIDVPAFVSAEPDASIAEEVKSGSIYPLPSSDKRYRTIASILLNNWGIVPETVRVIAPMKNMIADEVREGHDGGGLAD